MTQIHKLRRLTAMGIEQFWLHIDGCRQDKPNGVPIRQLPPSLVDGNEHTVELPMDVTIDLSLLFATRFDFAKYIVEHIGSAWGEELVEDIGFWAWLAVAYWLQFTARGVNRQEHYIPMIGSLTGRLGQQRVDYRHCARTPAFLVKRWGDDAKLFLSGPEQRQRPMAVMGDFIEQILSRQDVYGNERFLAVLRRLYADSSGFEIPGSMNPPKKKKLKNGKWSNVGRGGARRLMGGVLPRLKLTYQVDALTAEQIVSLAGAEFSNFPPEK